MIRSALKTGFKRLLGVEVKPAAAPAPPPAWREAPAAKLEPPKPVSVAAPVAPPVHPEVLPPTGPGAEPPAEKDPAGTQVAPTAAPPEKKAKSKKGAKPPALAVTALAAATAEAEPVVEAAPAPATDEVGPPAFSMEQVQELFDEMVRPALQGDGGDIALIRIEANDVYVRLVGSCSSCPSSVMTMKLGVEALLKEELPGFGNLIQVD